MIHAGGQPVFADVDADYCLDPESVRRQITPATKAILPVHLFGYVANMDDIGSIAEENSVAVIEDCAQAIGTKHRGRRVGGIGDAGAYSFFATKNMTTGEGGMIATDRDDVADLARMMRSHGMKGRDDHLVLGYNYRMTEMEAAIGMVQLQKIEEFNRKRRENSLYLYEQCKEVPWIGVQEFASHIDHTFFWCPIFVKEDVAGMNAAKVRAMLHEMGIGTRQRYQEPLYRQPLLREDNPYPRDFHFHCPFHGKTVRYEDLRFPNAEKFAGRLLGLPKHPNLTRQHLDRVVHALGSIQEKGNAWNLFQNLLKVIMIVAT